MQRIFTPIATVIFLLLITACGKSTSDPYNPNPPTPLDKKNLILMIGDGMGLSQITAASVANGGYLNIERCRHIGLQKVYASDKLVPSSASTATAMACGVKTKYLHIGVDHEGNRIPNIIEILEPANYSTGLITTSFIADATPVCFFAHNTDRYNQEEMALELPSSGLDVIIAGGRKYMNERQDSLNLLDSLTHKGYRVFDNLAGAMQTSEGKIACFTDAGQPPKMSEGRGDMLSKASQLAIEVLETNKNGFFLMVEGAQVDWACHDHDADFMLEEMLDFDDAVGKVLDYAESNKNTLVVILGDHETAGYALSGGNESTGEVESLFSTSNHTATMIPVFAYGPGAEQFTGVYENTELFTKFINYFNLQPNHKNNR